MIGVLLTLLACGGAPEADRATPAQPAAIDLAACAVCGMVVREQPAPRGQVLHRDGTRAFTCSLGDLRAHLAAPSPHGKAEHTWVETLPADLDPPALGVTARPWTPAQDAAYVVGIDRPEVMGAPLLSYADPEQAQAVAQRLGGRTTTWTVLEATPFGEVP